MNDKVNELMHHLSSESCRKVLGCLREGLTHPDDISKAMKVVRQTVDWHLLKLSALGVVERVPVSSVSGRPKINYRMSQDGEELIKSVEEVMRQHLDKLKKRYDSGHKELDRKLALGEISERAYKEAAGRIKKEMQFLGI